MKKPNPKDFSYISEHDHEDFDGASYYELMEQWEEEDTNPVIDQIIEDKLWP